MIRELKEYELNEILQLYLYLHETSIPADTEHLRTVWSEIIKDEPSLDCMRSGWQKQFYPIICCM